MRMRLTLSDNAVHHLLVYQMRRQLNTIPLRQTAAPQVATHTSAYRWEATAGWNLGSRPGRGLSSNPATPRSRKR